MNDNILNRILIEWNDLKSSENSKDIISANEISSDFQISNFYNSLPFGDEKFRTYRNEFFQNDKLLSNIYMLYSREYKADLTGVLAGNKNKLSFIFKIWQQDLFTIFARVYQVDIQRIREIEDRFYYGDPGTKSSISNTFQNIARENIDENIIPNEDSLLSTGQYYELVCLGMYYYIIEKLKNKKYILVDEWLDNHNKNIKYILLSKKIFPGKTPEKIYILLSLTQGSIKSQDPDEILPSYRFEISFLYKLPPE